MMTHLARLIGLAVFVAAWVAMAMLAIGATVAG
jgi:hypothetical protein